MNKNLKNKIEKKIGRKILNRGDCHYLSERIFNEINKNISYNTLRRAFDLDIRSNIKASNSTLNILSNFIGYNSYNEYNRESNWTKKWDLKIKVCGLINRMEDDELIYELNLAWVKNDNFAIIFVGVLRELLLLGKIKLANDVILKSKIDLVDLNYSELIFIGNGIGSVLRKIEVDEDDLEMLLKNKFFVDYIFLLFVDYSSLNGYYGLLYHITKRKKINLRYDQNLFFELINNFKDILLKKEIKFHKFHKINKEFLHPILIGRLASIEIAACNIMNINYDYILNYIYDRISLSNGHAIDYLYELKSISLIQKDFSLMQWICSCEKDINLKLKTNKHDEKNVLWSDNFLVNEEYHLSHEQYSFILQLILSIKNKEVKKTNLVLKRINKQKWVLSYHSFLDLFFSIANYHLTKDINRKSLAVDNYNKLFKHLNYPIFDKIYLKNYFN